MKLALRNWYERQSPRDQLVLRWGMAAAVLILLMAVLLPLQRSVAQARKQVAGKQADLQWMRSMGPALAAAGPGPPPVLLRPQPPWSSPRPRAH